MIDENKDCGLWNMWYILEESYSKNKHVNSNQIIEY
jgi:hypothetical protein